jgi:hypothetical protein
MNLIIVLLSVIAISDVLRLVGSYMKPSKKKFFENELYFLKKRIWNIEFQVSEKKQMRESVRKEYDFMSARIESITQSIANFPKDGNEEDKKRIEDDKVRAETDLRALEAQMRGLDIEIYGTKPCADYHDGVMGLTGEIESLRVIELSLKDWIKKI